MADPFRLRVLKGLTDLLKTVSVANGCSLDINGSVYRGRTEYGQETALPFISILSSPIPADQLDSPEGAPESAGRWDLLIQGFVEDDLVNPTDPAEILLADVKRILAKHRRDHARPKNYLGMEGRVYDMKIGLGVARPSDEISACSYFWLGLTLSIVEDLENPFA